MYIIINNRLSPNDTAHDILKNEIELILPQFPTRQMRSIITMLISGFIG